MKIKNNKPRKKINTSKFNKKNIFVKQKWILLVFVTDIIILVLGLVDNKPFDFGSYVVSVALVNLFMFYFIQFCKLLISSYLASIGIFWHEHVCSQLANDNREYCYGLY